MQDQINTCQNIISERKLNFKVKVKDDIMNHFIDEELQVPKIICIVIQTTCSIIPEREKVKVTCSNNYKDDSEPPHLKIDLTWKQKRGNESRRSSLNSSNTSNFDMLQKSQIKLLSNGSFTERSN